MVGKVDVIVGGFWGDEGKGKVISYLVNKRKAKIVARGGVGPNAGHTIVIGDQEYRLSMVPSGVGSPYVEQLLIGPGVLVNPEILLQEIKETKTQNKVYLDPQCGIIEDKHIKRDTSNKHLSEEVGTTGSGSGPANADRADRTLKTAEQVSELQDYLKDVPVEIHKTLAEGNNVVCEGTQATFLSLWHGTYPYVTSKDVTASAICSDVGIGPTEVTDVVLVLKAYVTRVGKGHLPNELTEEETKEKGWTEYGTVTGRLRRAAPFNPELANRAIMLNGATKIAVTKLDILFPENKGKNSYEELSEAAKDWVESIEKQIGMKISFIGTGPEATEIIDRES